MLPEMPWNKQGLSFPFKGRFCPPLKGTKGDGKKGRILNSSPFFDQRQSLYFTLLVSFMKKDISKNHLLRAAKLLCLIVLFLGLHQSLKAQSVLTAKSVALGGAGTAYLGGYEATFGNPANLVISNRAGNFHFGIGHVGILYEPVLSNDAVYEQFLNFTDPFLPYRVGTLNITARQRADILEQNYSSRSLVSQHQSRIDIILGGALWQHADKAYSIAARFRMASRIEVGRGWYSGNFITSQNRQVRDFTLNHWKSQLFELSFGYAREFTFYNGLSPRLNKLFVGIAPKIVVAGPRLNTTYDARYILNGNQNFPIYTSNFSYHATGEYAKATSAYLLSGNAPQAISRNLDRRFHFEPTGYGFGFDFGLTYLLPLGDELPTVDFNQPSVVSKSIRFALSINDIGMIYYTENPLALSSPKDTLQIDQQSVANSVFIGSGGQYFSYFDDAETIPNPLLTAQKISRDNYSALLPTSINAGILVELPRLKLMGDLTLGLNNTAFTSTKLMAHFGLEVRPIQQIPIRLGTRLAAGLPTRIGVGTGIETRHWNFTVGTQLLFKSQSITSEFAGAAFAGIQVHL